MTTKMSRRSILARGAAGTAVAALPIAATDAASLTGGDVALLALKPRFDRLFDEWVHLKVAMHAEHEENEALHERVIGFKRADAPPCDWDDPAWLAYDEALSKCFLSSGVGSGEPDDWDRLTNALHPLADEILAYNATTIEGLRLQVRALISSYDESWNPDHYEDHEPSEPWLRDFIRSVCGVLEVPFPPLPEGVR
jgi:hypothetical protein